MSDSYTETETVGCFSQLKESIKGVAVGLLMVVIAFPMLFINEWNAVTEAKGIKEVAANLTEVPSEKIDKGNEGKLIYSAGDAKVAKAAEDPTFQITDKGAVKIVRKSEIYQWVEKVEEKTEKKVGGKKEKPTYSKEWVSKPESSKDFEVKKGHGNSSGQWSDELASKDFAAKEVSVGAFDLPASLINKISGGEALSVTKKQAKALKESFGKVEVASGSFYMGKDPKDPSIGDVRISFEVVKADKLSFIAQQKGNTLAPYKAGNGRDYEYLSKGEVPSGKMIESAESGLAMLTWGLRFFGWFLMFAGIVLVFKPLVVIADVIPFVGNMLQTGITLFAGATSFGLSFITISIGWIFFRPLIGIPLCLCGLVSLGGLAALGVMAARKKKAAAAA